MKQWIVEVPLEHSAAARALLTTVEQARAITAGESYGAVFTREDDARTFSWLLREEKGILLPVKEVPL